MYHVQMILKLFVLVFGGQQANLDFEQAQQRGSCGVCRQPILNGSLNLTKDFPANQFLGILACRPVGVIHVPLDQSRFRSPQLFPLET